MLGTTLGTYDGTELGSTDGTSDGECEVFLLVDSIGSLDLPEVGFNEGTELLIYDGIVLGTKLCIYYGTDLGLS